MSYRILDKEQRIEGTRYSAIVICKGKVLLMARNNKGEEFYSLAGGHKRKGETDEQAVIREIKEETNVDIQNPGLVLDFLNWHDGVVQKVFVAYVEKETKPEIIGEEKDFPPDNTFEPVWVVVSKIPETTLYPLKVKEYIIEKFIR